MDYYKFVSAVEEAVKQLLEPGISVFIHTAVKNNGKERKGLLFTGKGRNVSPTIYLEEYYESFRCGGSVKEIADKIMTLYNGMEAKEAIGEEEISCYSWIRERVVYKLINYSANKEMLADMPYVSYLDLAIVFYVLLEANKRSTVTMPVKIEHLELWDVTKEMLYTEAKKNTEILLCPEFKPMNAVVRGMLMSDEEEGIEEGEDGKDFDDVMYVLTNQIRNQGAVCILYNNVLSGIARKLGENYYVLPSSIHEVIIIPESKSPNQSELEEMVREVNEAHVEDEEVLSNHVYYYNRKENTLVL